MADRSTPVYSRSHRVLWRQGADRVLVRRVGDEALELTGVAGFVWLALDEPRDVDAVITQLSTELPGDDHAGIRETLMEAIEGLLGHGVIEERP